MKTRRAEPEQRISYVLAKFGTVQDRFVGYPFSDKLYQIVRAMDGAVQDRIHYTAYGERRSATYPDAGGPDSSSNRRCFTNHQHFGASTSSV